MTGETVAAGEPADAAHIDAAREGDLYAWEHLVRLHQEKVFRVAYLVVRSTDLAATATQSSFIRAYRALPSFDDEIGLTPWLFRIAASEARQQRRESGRPRPSSRPPEDSTGPQIPATAVPGVAEAAGLTNAEKEAISDAFDRLGEEDRLVIAARYLFGLSRTDAAAALSIASGLVDGHLATAIKRLRSRMVDS